MTKANLLALADGLVMARECAAIARLALGKNQPDGLDALAAQYIRDGFEDWSHGVRSALAMHAKMAGEVERLREALTPSAETKAAYMGEFTMPFPCLDESGEEVMAHPNVPWTTIKEIMKAIRARRARSQPAWGD